MWELFFRVRSAGFAGSDTSLSDMSSVGGRCDVKSSELSHSSGCEQCQTASVPVPRCLQRTKGPCRHTDDLPSELGSWITTVARLFHRTFRSLPALASLQKKQRCPPASCTESMEWLRKKARRTRRDESCLDKLGHGCGLLRQYGEGGDKSLADSPSLMFGSIPSTHLTRRANF